MMFKRYHIKRILQGRKTQTRRTGKRRYKIGHRYGIRSSWFQKSVAHILITRRFMERLGDISQEDVRKEGYRTLEEFQAAWIAINGGWDPETIVTAYEFRVVDVERDRLK